MIKAVFFDLFFTLIYPHYSSTNNEFDILNITKEEWEMHAENSILYKERAIGKVISEEEIIKQILKAFENEKYYEQYERVLDSRLSRMRAAIDNVNDDIIFTLSELRKHNIKLCLISNADVINCKYWNESVLSTYFDKSIFSCNVGILKPDENIYKLAMNQMGVKASESIFVGDGGSNELFGAKQVGMKTVFTEYLEKKEENERKSILLHADYVIDQFNQLLEVVI
jgi:putative hydrolase of the HAD superfamily